MNFRCLPRPSLKGKAEGRGTGLGAKPDPVFSLSQIQRIGARLEFLPVRKQWKC